MAHENTVFQVKNEIDEVQREIDLIGEKTDLGYGLRESDDKMISISAGDLKKIELRLYDLLSVLKGASVMLPFPCRNGK